MKIGAFLTVILVSWVFTWATPVTAQTCKIPTLKCSGLDFYQKVVAARWTSLGDPKCSTALSLDSGGLESNSVIIEVTDRLMVRIDGSLERIVADHTANPDTHSLVFQAQPGVEFKIKSRYLNATCVAK